MFKNQLSKNEKPKPKINNLNDTLVILIKIAGIFIFCIFGIYFLNFGSLGISNNSEVWAQFGDFIGGILNPLLAFLAFIALLFTIKLQSDALNISKEELEATRKELEKSRIAQEEQSKSLILQNKATNLQMFENTFFKLLDLYKGIKHGLYFDLTVYIHDSDSISFTETNDIPFELSTHSRNGNESQGQVMGETALYSYLLSIQIINSKSKKSINEYYPDFHRKLEKYIGNYFSTIYQIFKFIKSSNIEDKQRYAHFLRSQFSEIEMEILFYHCISETGIEKFKPLLEEYEFLEHLNYKEHFKKNDILDYNQSVFGLNSSWNETFND